MHVENQRVIPAKARSAASREPWCGTMALGSRGPMGRLARTTTKKTPGDQVSARPAIVRIAFA
jgi:hypothetical protein